MRAKGRGSVGRPLPDDCTYSIYPDLPAPLCVQSEVLVTSNILATSQNGSFRYRPVYPGISGLFTQDCLGTLFLSMLPLPARVTARIIAFLVGDPYKSLFLVILFSSFLPVFPSNPTPNYASTWSLCPWFLTVVGCVFLRVLRKTCIKNIWIMWEAQFFDKSWSNEIISHEPEWTFWVILRQDLLC